MSESLTNTLASTSELIAALSRIEINKMTPAELDLAMAFSLAGVRVAVPIFEAVKLENDKIFVYTNQQWRPFSATSNWDDFGLVINNTQLVMSTHSAANVEGAPAPYWYSAQASFGGTKFNAGTDIRIAVGRAVASLLRSLK